MNRKMCNTLAVLLSITMIVNVLVDFTWNPETVLILVVGATLLITSARRIFIKE